MLLSRNTVVENDGEQHFRNSNWNVQDYKQTQQQDVNKMKKAIENNISGIRLFQPDVLSDKYDWRQWIKKALDIIVSNPTSLWIFPDIDIYDPYIKCCKDKNITYKILSTL